MRPYVIINCAMSADGKIALPSRRQTRLSCEEDIARVHQLRNDCNAIIVGIGTILTDDPKLTVKKRYVPEPHQPLRVVLDSHGRTPADALVMNSQAPTLIVTASDHTIKTDDASEVLRCGTDRVDIPCLLKELAARGIKSVLVEGGETVIWEFLRLYLVDRLTVYVAPMVIGGTTSPTMAGGRGASSVDDRIPLHLEKTERLGDGVLLTYRPSITDDLDN